jgi:hypothetical protein
VEADFYLCDVCKEKASKDSRISVPIDNKYNGIESVTDYYTVDLCYKCSIKILSALIKKNDHLDRYVGGQNLKEIVDKLKKKVS